MNNTHSRIPATIQKNLAASYKSSVKLQTTKADATVRPQRTVRGEISRVMVGDHKGQRGLLLVRKMMMPKYVLIILLLRQVRSLMDTLPGRHTVGGSKVMGKSQLVSERGLLSH